MAAGFPSWSLLLLLSPSLFLLFLLSRDVNTTAGATGGTSGVGIMTAAAADAAAGDQSRNRDGDDEDDGCCCCCECEDDMMYRYGVVRKEKNMISF